MSRATAVTAAAFAFFLATLPATLLAQQSPMAPGQSQPEPRTSQAGPDTDGWENWRNWMRERMWGDDRGSGRMMDRGPGMMWGDDWGPGHMMGRGGGLGPGMMWGGGLPMHSGMMPMMMMAMMDTDGNGLISYEEVEAVHRRMFNLVDQDSNGELSPEEIRDVMGWRIERGDDVDDDDDD